MRCFNTLENKKIDSIAIGGFDGVHKAHQYLISRLSKNSAVVIIDKKSASLTPDTQRCRYIKTGVCFLEYENIKELTPQEFITLLTQKFKNLKKIVIGYDFRFGKNRVGDIKLLKEIFDKEVEIVKQIKLDHVPIHSRVIKKFIKEKNIKMANKLLGREYLISGEVIKGLGLGKKNLYPTINIKTNKFLIPQNGVYATKANINGEKIPAITFIGNRLSIDNSFSIETHLIDYKNSIKIDFLEIEFVNFLREIKKFSTLKELKKEISKDIKKAKLELGISF